MAHTSKACGHGLVVYSHSILGVQYANAIDAGVDRESNDADGSLTCPQAHLSKRIAAERRRDGVRTSVRFVDIPFESLSTANLVDAIVRPLCRERDACYAFGAEGVAVGSPTHFVSHAWGNRFGHRVLCFSMSPLHAYAKTPTQTGVQK